jgi:hypothetical protein
MPEGKPAGVRCIHLDEHFACKLFHSPERPEVCRRFKAEEIVCGTNREEAIANLTKLEHTPSRDLF